MLTHEYLERHSSRSPRKTALVFQDLTCTYRHINEQSNRLAHALLELGLRSGDRVALFLDNSPELVISVYGVLKAGGVFIPLNATMKSGKLEYILNNAGASFLVSDWKKIATVSDAALSCPSLMTTVLCGERPSSVTTRLKHIDWETCLEGRRHTDPRPSRIDLDLAYIIYTSGSTGEPKGVMMTHRSTVSAASSIISYLKNTGSDVILDVLPLSFDYGLYQVLMAFMFGGTVVLEKNFSYPYVIVERLVSHGVTGFPGVPTVFALLMQMDLSKIALPRLRYITNTGASFPVQHIKKLRQALPHVKIYSMYGLTECKRVSYLPPEEIDTRPESVGRGMPNEQVFVVDEQGAPVAAGVTGELVVRGSNIMKGYWQAPEETAHRLRPGRYEGETLLYTGDLFKMDDEGYLYFAGRRDDLIKTRGERVSPREVENALCEIDGVAEAAVIGVPDEILGCAIKAFIRPSGTKPLDERDIQRNCASRLESFMVPKTVKILEEFPRTSTGKVDKKALAHAGCAAAV